MKLRRYYPKGFKGRTYSNEYLETLAKKGVNTAIVDNARVELLLARAEQEVFYQRCVGLVLSRTRWVLNNLDRLVEFKVNWENYKPKKGSKPKDL